MKSEVVGRPSAVSDDFLQGERRRFTISELSCEFAVILRTLLYEIIAVRLGCQKICSMLVPKMLTYAHKTQRMVSALTFSERFFNGGDEFLSHIV
jgi:hypothetical protein